MKSNNSSYYTEYGWVKLLQKSSEPESVKRIISHLKQITISWYNDHAKAARVIFTVPYEAPAAMQKTLSFLKSLPNNDQILNEIGINDKKAAESIYYVQNQQQTVHTNASLKV